MAFGTKTNERPGTRAQVRYVRVSAYKAREVLNVIRGESVARALELLDFVERDVARVIRKCLESAVANAEHNDGQAADELYVSACYADEGPTLKRWRPRARGRATRIRKRTTHITIIVSRMDEAELARLRERETSGRGAGNRAAAASRRERVARSRQGKAERRAAEEHDHDHDHEDHDHEDESTPATDEAVADESAAPADGAEATAADAEAGEAAATDDEAAEQGSADDDEKSED
jgi:large subunit ribosomal protein L22